MLSYPGESYLQPNFSEPVLWNFSVSEILDLQYQRDLVGHYFMGISTLTISCIGFLGNLLSIGVLTSKFMKGTTTNLYLTALAASDAMMLFFAILVAIRDTRKPQRGVVVWQLWDDMKFVPLLYPICHAFALLFQVCSNWLTAAFTVDRYLMICHPFIAKRLCTLRRSKCVLAFIVAASLCYTAPRFHEYTYFNPQTEWRLVSPHQLQNSVHLPLQWYKLSEMGESETFKFGYHLWAWCVLVIGVPSIVIAVLNIFLVREIKQSIQRMRFEQGVKTRRHETDVMLIGVIVIFFVCQIPSSVSHVFWALLGAHNSRTLSWIILNEVGNLFVILNASINIIPYYLFGKRFRTLFIQIYFGWLPACCKRRRRGHNWDSLPANPQPLVLINGRPRLPSRVTSQPLFYGKRDSSPSIIINLDGHDPIFY